MAKRSVLLAGMIAAGSASAAAAPNAVRDVASPVTAVSAKDLEAFSANRSLAGVLGAMRCDARTVPTFSGPAAANGAVSTTDVKGVLGCVSPGDLRMVEIYTAHNAARSRFGSQPLIWDPQLAQGAAIYAREISRTGLVHSTRESRPRDVRENLLRGLRGDNGYRLVSNWLDEERLFRPGVFPNVSANGDWSAVSHFTQMVWPTTTRVGCAGFDDRRWYWLVCRYAGPGNRDGTTIAPVRLPPPARAGEERG